jgi:hypothetical protein
MRVMNKRMNLPNMQKILMEFEKQNERMDMTSEMMGDAIDDAMEVGEGPGRTRRVNDRGHLVEAVEWQPWQQLRQLGACCRTAGGPHNSCGPDSRLFDASELVRPIWMNPQAPTLCVVCPVCLPG